MPFLALGALAGGALGAAGVGGATLLGGAAMGAGVGAAVQGLSDSRKAQKDAMAAAEKGQVDINRLDQIIRQISLRNATESAELERRLTPEVPQLRTAANNAVLQGLQPNEIEDETMAMLRSRLNQGVSTPLLDEAIAKARQDLALGGQLPQDVRNLVARQSGARAGTVAPGQLNLGRDLMTRDLGLTSLDLENQRLSNASLLGGQELQKEQFGSSNFLNMLQTLQGNVNNRKSFALGAAQYAQGIPQPQVGIDPASAANISVGNQNAQQAAAANAANIRGTTGQGITQLGGQFLGFGLSSLK